jgi:hypothetical protein
MQLSGKILGGFGRHPPRLGRWGMASSPRAFTSVAHCPFGPDMGFDAAFPFVAVKERAGRLLGVVATQRGRYRDLPRHEVRRPTRDNAIGPCLLAQRPSPPGWAFLLAPSPAIWPSTSRNLACCQRPHPGCQAKSAATVQDRLRPSVALGRQQQKKPHSTPLEEVCGQVVRATSSSRSVFFSSRRTNQVATRCSSHTGNR